MNCGEFPELNTLELVVSADATEVAADRCYHC